MNRKDFIQLCVLGTAAVATGTLHSCGKDDGVSPGGSATPPPASGSIDFTLDLTAPANAQLAAGTGFVYGAGNQVLVAKTSAGAYVALQASCTHEGVMLSFNSGTNQVQCPRHGGTYSSTGTVLAGPPPASLKQYTVVQTGNSLRITG
ncbi:QcrA and Rieske domain-containing protein [Hymenobacter terrestris]|uniref:Rieske (2Fe-2S) protein n=1 Tax=Hymenobacter terrestris TaxID=2748310 RepID=A0ABX2Q6W4_9BACT|nr:Rieske (2Fe-2S) protein [Hymenobacter terrestris]NVO85482.1 Rieske (2Fe-2S) protein [Hymenobacter terrestris]